jgi:hypothetical protein
VRYAIIIVSPLLLFGLVVGLGLWLTDGDASLEEAMPHLASRGDERVVASVQLAMSPPAAASRIVDQGQAGAREEGHVPRALASPLRAVAPNINLCIPHSLERDLGPIDVSVRFTPVRGGAFAPGVQVSTSWSDPVIEGCIAEVFEESTFMPEPDGRFEPTEFVFHFPDDAETGLLGMSALR